MEEFYLPCANRPNRSRNYLFCKITSHGFVYVITLFTLLHYIVIKFLFRYLSPVRTSENNNTLKTGLLDKMKKGCTKFGKRSNK